MGKEQLLYRELSPVAQAFTKVSNHYSASITAQALALVRDYGQQIDLIPELEKLKENDRELVVLAEVANATHQNKIKSLPEGERHHLPHTISKGQVHFVLEGISLRLPMALELSADQIVFKRPTRL